MEIVNFFVIVLCILLGIEPNGHNVTTGEKTDPLRKKASLELKEPILRKPGDVSPTVIGGYEATPHDFPYAVILHILRKRGLGMGLCGGTLITTNYVLTAAHCLNNAVSVKVFLGGHDLYGDNTDPNIITMESDALVIHEKYGGLNSGKNDIGLVRLPKKVRLNENISILELAEGNDLFVGSVGIFLGWGTSADGAHSEVLKFTALKILSNEECASIFGDFIQDYHLCALGNGTQGGCYGDSGGPLLVGCVQVGVTAVVTEGCKTGKPTVFTRLREFTNWISNHTQRRKRRKRKRKRRRVKGRGDKITSILEMYIVLLMFCLVFTN